MCITENWQIVNSKIYYHIPEKQGYQIISPSCRGSLKHGAVFIIILSGTERYKKKGTSRRASSWISMCRAKTALKLVLSKFTAQGAPRACEHPMYFARLNIQILQKYTQEVVLHLGTSNESKRSKVFFFCTNYIFSLHVHIPVLSKFYYRTCLWKDCAS